MKIFADIAEMFVRNVGINLGGGNVGVAVNWFYCVDIYGIMLKTNQ